MVLQSSVDWLLLTGSVMAVENRAASNKRASSAASDTSSVSMTSTRQRVDVVTVLLVKDYRILVRTM